MEFIQLLPLIIAGYTFIASVLLAQYRRGLRGSKAVRTYRTWYGAPRYTIRDSKGRFMANKVGIFHIATQGIL